MYQHHPSVNMSSESKTQAAFRLNNFKQKLRRIRHKRELVDRPFPKDLDNLFASVRGTESWAKIAPGSIKIVKRHHDL
jgi:hypothetical protein